MHIGHPLLRPEAVEFRGYQANLARIAAQKDTLVVLPTGLGKTIVAVLVLADAIHAGAQRILVLAPTRPLVDQHGATLKELLQPPWNERVHVLTGHQAPAKRAAAYGEPGIVVATPQVVQNDLVAGRLLSNALDWVVFDEAHRAVGDYPYVFLGRELQRAGRKARRLGLTASPGHDVEKIQQVRANLGLVRAEVRTPADADVAPYIQPVDVEWETLPLPPTMAHVGRLLREALDERIAALRKLGAQISARPSRTQLLEVGRRLQALVQSTPNPPSEAFTSLSLQAQAMKIQHGIEQAETQGPAAFVEYLENLRREAAGPRPSKASQSVATDARINQAFHVARFDDSESPKMGRTSVLVRELVERRPGSRAIVFAQYRSTCEALAKFLAGLPGVNPVVFVGQQTRGGQAGLTQKQQRGILDRFRAGEFNVLLATSVAEEGLDIPSTDLVVFYEPIASEIRAIQRRGRTGRMAGGRVVVLMTKGTMDEAAHWSSRRKEAAMVQELQRLRAGLGAPPPVAQAPRQSALPPAAAAGAPRTSGEGANAPHAHLGQAPRIIVDAREQGGGVVRHLHELGAKLEPRTLDVGDYIVSDRVVVERKECADFVDSLLDGRLWQQAKQLRDWPHAILVVEGPSLWGHRNVQPEALFGALASLSLDYGIPVLQTHDGLETARFLLAVAKREQFRHNRGVAVRPGKPDHPDEVQVFLVGGLPGVSDTLARRLLSHFGSAGAVFAASAAQLEAVEGIGPERAREIRAALESRWAGTGTV